jgi:hypothetical protein
VHAVCQTREAVAPASEDLAFGRLSEGALYSSVAKPVWVAILFPRQW